MARQLSCKTNEIEIWETSQPPANVTDQILFFARQVEMCSEEVRTTPIAECTLDQNCLGQIKVSELEQES